MRNCRQSDAERRCSVPRGNSILNWQQVASDAAQYMGSTALSGDKARQQRDRAVAAELYGFVRDRSGERTPLDDVPLREEMTGSRILAPQRS